MGRSVAQQVAVSIGGPQTVIVDPPVESHSTAQEVIVTMGTAYQLVVVNPAQKLPTE